MGLLEETLRGKSLADYTNTQLRLALGAVLHTNTADMWKRYLNQIGYTGDVSQMLQKYYVDYSVPSNFRNYINAGASIFNPQNMFAADAGLQGYVYDLNDLSTLYLDSAGTTAASVNGLVGLALDKSKELALGAEIRSSGAIGLVGAATVATYNTTTGEGTATRVDASNQSFVQWSGLATGSWYLLTIQNTGANAITVRAGSHAGTIWLTLLVAETKTIYVPEGSGLVTIASSGGAVAFTLSTIKQAQGNHAYQSTTGNKPVLRGSPVGGNLVTNGDFATDTVWTKGTGWSVGSGVATKTAGTASGIDQPYVFTTGKVYRCTYTITVSAGAFQFSFTGGTTTSGAVRTASGTYVEYLTAQTGNNSIYLFGTSLFAGTVDNVEIVDVSAGSVQAPYALQFDGVDDFLQTASVNFTATDKMTVCHGVRKLRDSAFSILAELSASLNANNGTFYLTAPQSASDTFGSASKGTISTTRSQTGNAAPKTAVLTGLFDIAGDNTTLRVNTTPASTLADQGTGNYGNYALYFGRRGGASNPYNGLMYSAICVGKATSATELANIERWTNQRTGAY